MGETIHSDHGEHFQVIPGLSEFSEGGKILDAGKELSAEETGILQDLAESTDDISRLLDENNAHGYTFTDIEDQVAWYLKDVEQLYSNFPDVTARLADERPYIRYTQIAEKLNQPVISPENIAQRLSSPEESISSEVSTEQIPSDVKQETQEQLGVLHHDVTETVGTTGIQEDISDEQISPEHIQEPVEQEAVGDAIEPISAEVAGQGVEYTDENGHIVDIPFPSETIGAIEMGYIPVEGIDYIVDQDIILLKGSKKMKTLFALMRDNADLMLSFGFQGCIPCQQNKESYMGWESPDKPPMVYIDREIDGEVYSNFLEGDTDLFYDGQLTEYFGLPLNVLVKNIVDDVSGDMTSQPVIVENAILDETNFSDIRNNIKPKSMQTSVDLA